MPIVLTLFLVLACAPVPWPAPYWGGPAASFCITLALLGATLARFVWVSGRTLRLIRDPILRCDALNRYARVRGRSLFMLMAAFTAAMTLGGWGWTVQTTLRSAAEPFNVLPGAEWVIIAPFLASLVASWLAFYPVERMAHRAPSLLAYMVFQFRHQLVLALLPLSLVIAEQTLARSSAELIERAWFQIAAVVAVVTILIAAPWLLRILLGWTPLPPGPLRDRLTASARRLGLRYSDLMFWPTHEAMANAMVTGLIPRPRYIVMTDRLINELTPEELEAVLGHEIGHVRHRHMLLYMLFLGLSLTALSGLLGLAEDNLAADSLLRSSIAWLGDWSTLIALGGAAIYVLFGFGFLSRRCEREADLFGCRAVSCGKPDCAHHFGSEVVSSVTTRTPPCPTAIDTFTSALERVAVANGISRSRPGWLSSWQHSTIARRVDFLDRVKANPRLERRFRHRMFWFKAVVILGLAALVGWLFAGGDLGWSSL